MEMQKEQRRFLIFIAVVFALMFGIFFFGWISGDEGAVDGAAGAARSGRSSSGWSIWIPLGPLWIGWGPGGFQWSVSFSFY